MEGPEKEGISSFDVYLCNLCFVCLEHAELTSRCFFMLPFVKKLKHSGFMGCGYNFTVFRSRKT